jgi:pimeloyl-ACP methyl ester carboxylesterase
MSEERPARPRGLDWIASRVDHAARKLALSRSERSRRRSSSESLGPRERAEALSALVARYATPENLDPARFFPTPEAPAITARLVRRRPRGGEVRDLAWESGYVPFADDVRERHLSFAANRTVHARAFVHGDRPRPTVLLVHGYLGGHHAMEERAWPLSWLEKKGLDAILTVLPLHAARGDGGRPKFPSSDPRLTIEGFRQAVHDLRSLVSHLEAEGAPAIGVMGMSLGGYTSALLATAEPRLSFSVPFIPLASIADFANDSDRFVGMASQRREQHELLERVFSVVSPLARPVLVKPEGRLVVGARGDRITPPKHAERLAAHFGSELVLFSGGHLLQVGRSEGFRAIGRMLGGLGLLDA